MQHRIEKIPRNGSGRNDELSCPRVREPGDPRRAQIAEQLSELSLLAQQLEKPEVVH